MAELIGASGSRFNTAMPSFVDAANIQAALRYFLYGIASGGAPADAETATPVSLFTHLANLDDLKATIASPTFTGTVTIPTLTVTSLTNALPIAEGGTGARTAENARISLGTVLFSSTASQGTASSSRVFVQSSQPSSAAAGDLWLW